MSMEAILSEGVIENLSKGDQEVLETTPVLQVYDVRLVNAQNASSNTERYRLALSDGIHLMQGMLGTQLNDLVRSKQVQTGSVVRLKQFVSNVIQGRRIIIIIDLDVIRERCDTIGEPVQYRENSDAASVAAPSSTVNPMNQPRTLPSSAPMRNLAAPSSAPMHNLAVPGSVPMHNSVVTGSVPMHNSAVPGSVPMHNSAVPGSVPMHKSAVPGSAHMHNLAGGTHMQYAEVPSNIGSNIRTNSFAANNNSTAAPPMYGRTETYSTAAAPMYGRTETYSGNSGGPLNGYSRQHQGAVYQQPSAVFMNRGPIAKNEAPPKITPIDALNPYQGKWTIKARVAAKGELRSYNNARGDGKVFSFDLLDSSGEIRVTCFNAVAEQFYDQVELGKVYMISKGTLKPAQKKFNHLAHEYEISLDSNSTIHPCVEDDNDIPSIKYNFRPISDIEGLDNNSIVDVIGVVSSISPASTIMTKNGTETQRRVLQLKDMSGRSVSFTLWGKFCNAEGETLQNICDSGSFPVLAVKSCKVSDFNGRALGTISTSQLDIEPVSSVAQTLKAWFEHEGKKAPFISLSREATSTGHTDLRKSVSQIKDERLGTSEKPDWITVSATITFVKAENFCYTACPIQINDRQCSKKVTNNGDGKWRCERCDQTVDECDYRYVLQLQIQDHTGLAWVTAFQEGGEQIMGLSAKELYLLKYEEQDDERFAEILKNVLFTKFHFKLKVKEETYNDEQRVKSTVTKADKINYPSETKYLLELMHKMKMEDSGSVPLKADNTKPDPVVNNSSFGGRNDEFAAATIPNYGSVASGAVRDGGSSYGSQYGGPGLVSNSSANIYSSCNSCGGSGHSAANCPSVRTSAQGRPFGGGYGNTTAAAPAVNGGDTSTECFKCHQFGHWARDCPGLGNTTAAAPAVNGGNASRECFKCHQFGHFANECPGFGNTTTAAPAVNGGKASRECYKCHQLGHFANECPGLNNAPPAYGVANSNSGGRYGNFHR